MGRRVKETIKKVNKVTEIVGSHHTGAYAAQAAYFFVLSMIPIILLLLTAVQFTPATYANVIDAVEQVFPTSVQGFFIYRDLHSCNRTVTGSVCIWKQYQRHDLQACTVLEYSDAVYY